MPQFTLHRNFILRTTKGHAIQFKKGQPTNVPPVIVPDAVAIGAIPVDSSVDVLGAEEKEQIPLTPAERKEIVFKAFDTMKGRSERLDFTASGLPNAKRLPALTGFEVTSKERDDYWVEYRAIEQETKDQTNLDVAVASVTAAEANVVAG